MKGFLATIGGLAVMASVTSASAQQQALAQLLAPPQPQWTTNFSTETRFSWYRTDMPVPNHPETTKQEATEIYIPFAAQVSGKPTNDLQIDLVARGGWVRARQITAGQSGEVAAATDTVASATFTYQGWAGIQPFVAVETNLPTGKPALFGPFAPNARLDPDFVDVSSFGEGFNIGPTLGFNIPLSETLLFTTSVGYTWRGVFYSEGPFQIDPPQGTTRTNPGDDLTVTAGVTATFGQFSVNLTGTVSEETATTINKVRTFRPGNRYLASTQISYNWPENWGATTFTGSAAYSNRNQIVFTSFDNNGLVINSPLGSEPFNSNSTIYRVGLQHMFPVGQFQVGPTASFLYRHHNSYDSVDLQFIPAKTRWSAGVLAQFAPSETVSFNARVEGILTRANENPVGAAGDGTPIKIDPVTQSIFAQDSTPPVDGIGVQASLGVNIRY